jgi:hypothetical protein
LRNNMRMVLLLVHPLFFAIDGHRCMMINFQTVRTGLFFMQCCVPET